MAQQPGAKYLESKIMTASREQLVLMMYDGFLRFAETGKVALIEKNWELSTKSLTRCQDILLEFICTLDKENGGDIAVNLAKLYHYAYKRLVDACVKHVTDPIDEVVGIIQPLRDAWAEAMKQVEQTAPVHISQANTIAISAADSPAIPAEPEPVAEESDTPASPPPPTLPQPNIARLARPTGAYSAFAKLPKSPAGNAPAVAKTIAPATKVLAKIPLAKIAVAADDIDRPRLSVDG